MRVCVCVWCRQYFHFTFETIRKTCATMMGLHFTVFAKLSGRVHSHITVSGWNGVDNTNMRT